MRKAGVGLVFSLAGRGGFQTPHAALRLLLIRSPSVDGSRSLVLASCGLDPEVELQCLAMQSSTALQGV